MHHRLGLRGDDDDDEDDGYGGGRRSNRDDPARDREALGLGGPGGSSRRYGTAAADPFPSTAPRFRSANEIKQSYGRGGGAAGTTSTRDVTGRCVCSYASARMGGHVSPAPTVHAALAPHLP